MVIKENAVVEIVGRLVNKCEYDRNGRGFHKPNHMLLIDHFHSDNHFFDAFLSHGYGLQCPPHRQSLKYRRRLEKCEPAVSNRQENHKNNFHSPHELARKDARIGHVFPDEC